MKHFENLLAIVRLLYLKLSWQMTSSSESRFPLDAKDYELLEEIGDGVYRSRCIVLDEIVAVKILDLENCSDDVETIRQQVHPHCCFLDGSSFWIVKPSGAESLIGEEDLASDKLKIEEVLTSEIPASPVNPLSCDAAQILPLLQNLLLQNEIQRERLMGLIQLYNPTTDEINRMEGGQISRETDLSSEVHLLEQSLKKLEEEVENQKEANAQLEDEIKRLTKSSDS